MLHNCDLCRTKQCLIRAHCHPTTDMLCTVAIIYFINKCFHHHFHFWSILVGRVGRSKNGRRYFKLILCYFCLTISPHTKFHPNRMKNTEVENFHFWSILVGRAGRSKNGRNHFKHSESLERLTKDLCTKFEPNQTKIG